MALHYTGKPPSMKHYKRDEDGRQRLPISERGPGYDGLPGHGKLIHSTRVEVAARTANNPNGDTMRRLNKMFTNVAANEMPVASRGRTAKDLSNDPVYVALKGQPVSDSYFSDGKEYTEDAARKFQSKVSAYAKAGAGTFSTTYRGGKVYIKKTADTYTKQRGE